MIQRVLSRRQLRAAVLSCCSVAFLGMLCDAMAAAAAEAAPPVNTLTASELAEGWISLFDGKTLYGWRVASKADWKVVDGAIEVREGQAGLLHTTTQFADYELKLDFKADKGTNSGIFLRTPPKPQDPARDCYELNIAAPRESPFPTGSFVNRKKGTNTTFDDTWHQYHVVVRGQKFLIYLDGKLVLDYVDERFLGRGYIGLQRNSGRVAFRNVKLKPLGTESIFNGRDLTGWRVFPGKKSEFSVREGALRIVNGPGQIETTGQWADFILQTEVRVDGDELNSGIFFRSIPGDFSMGYESQIHNGMIEGDPGRPNNYGTGGIFRRQKARFVVAKDREWFHKTIICEGKHMAVWVNGAQVSGWTDRRAAHDNPRQGLRVQKGTIILQGHDPTTDLSFRNMRVVEMATRR